MEARMPPHPALHPGMFVGPIVVHDEMQIEMGLGLGVDLLQVVLVRPFLIENAAADLLDRGAHHQHGSHLLTEREV